MTNLPEDKDRRKPSIFRARPGMSELDQLLEEWAETLSDEERESALRILRPSDENEEETPAEKGGDTEETP